MYIYLLDFKNEICYILIASVHIINYRISCDTGITWQSYDIVLNNHTAFHMDGLYTEMSDTASIAT